MKYIISSIIIILSVYFYVFHYKVRVDNDTEGKLSDIKVFATQDNAPINLEEDKLILVEPNKKTNGLTSSLDFIDMYYTKLTTDSNDYKEIYQHILDENNSATRRELVIMYFELFIPRSGDSPQYTDDELSDILGKALSLIRNEDTREEAIANASGILSDEELSHIYEELNNVLTQENKNNLSSQYVNMRLINGKEPDANKAIYKNYEKINSEQSMRQRGEAIANLFDDEEQKRNIITTSRSASSGEGEAPPSKNNFNAYINWIRAQLLYMGNVEQEKFLTNQFDSFSSNEKREFIVLAPEHIHNINHSNLLPYLAVSYSQYISSVYNNTDFDDVKVSGNLSLFRSIFKYSENTKAVAYLDKKIKNDIGTYPSTAHAHNALNMIRDEGIYIPEEGFNIEDYTQGEKGEEENPSKLY